MKDTNSQKKHLIFKKNPNTWLIKLIHHASIFIHDRIPLYRIMNRFPKIEWGLLGNAGFCFLGLFRRPAALFFFLADRPSSPRSFFRRSGVVGLLSNRDWAILEFVYGSDSATTIAGCVRMWRSSTYRVVVWPAWVPLASLNVLLH